MSAVIFEVSPLCAQTWHSSLPLRGYDAEKTNKQTKRSADQESHEGGNVHHSAPDNYETWGHFLQHCGSHLSYLKTKEVNLHGL